MHGFDDPFDGYRDGDDFRDDDRLSFNDEQRMRNAKAARAIRERMMRNFVSDPVPSTAPTATPDLDAAMWEAVEHFTDEVWLNFDSKALYDWSGRGPIIQ